MSKEINDGGPAFPRLRKLDNQFNKPWVAETVGGMSLRDWFAGQALVGLFACGLWNNSMRQSSFPDELSEHAFMMADAMLKAREAQS